MSPNNDLDKRSGSVTQASNHITEKRSVPRASNHITERVGYINTSNRHVKSTTKWSFRLLEKMIQNGHLTKAAAFQKRFMINFNDENHYLIWCFKQIEKMIQDDNISDAEIFRKQFMSDISSERSWHQLLCHYHNWSMSHWSSLLQVFNVSFIHMFYKLHLHDFSRALELYEYMSKAEKHDLYYEYYNVISDSNSIDMTFIFLADDSLDVMSKHMVEIIWGSSEGRSRYSYNPDIRYDLCAAWLRHPKSNVIFTEESKVFDPEIDIVGFINHIFYPSTKKSRVFLGIWENLSQNDEKIIDLIMDHATFNPNVFVSNIFGETMLGNFLLRHKMYDLLAKLMRHPLTKFGYGHNKLLDTVLHCDCDVIERVLHDNHEYMSLETNSCIIMNYPEKRKILDQYLYEDRMLALLMRLKKHKSNICDFRVGKLCLEF
jgi:hypothetical protein